MSEQVETEEPPPEKGEDGREERDSALKSTDLVRVLWRAALHTARGVTSTCWEHGTSNAREMRCRRPGSTPSWKKSMAWDSDYAQEAIGRRPPENTSLTRCTSSTPHSLQVPAHLLSNGSQGREQPEQAFGHRSHPCRRWSPRSGSRSLCVCVDKCVWPIPGAQLVLMRIELGSVQGSKSSRRSQGGVRRMESQPAPLLPVHPRREHSRRTCSQQNQCECALHSSDASSFRLCTGRLCYHIRLGSCC